MAKASGQTVSARTRRVVAEFLQTMRNPDSFLEMMNSVMERITEQDAELIPAFAEVLNTQDDSEAQVYAAATILITNSIEPSLVDDRPLIIRATKAITDALAPQKGDDRILPCALMTMGGAPPPVIPILRKLFKEKNEHLKVLAAAALAACGEGDLPVLQQLERSLGANDELVVGVAAWCFARMGSRIPNAVAKLLHALSLVEEGLKYQILLALKAIGPGAKAAVPALSALVVDKKTHPYLRHVAATVVGEITNNTALGTPVLMQALEAEEAQVVDGAVKGLINSGNIPKEAVERLIILLSSTNQEMRITAAEGLAAIGTRAAPAVAPLIARIGRETDGRMVLAMAQALAAAGDAAMNPLLKIAKTTDFITLWIVKHVFGLMGETAVAALIKSIEETNDEWSVELLHGTLANGDVTVPTLASFLDETDDDEVALSLIKAIFLKGESARAATHSLVQAIMYRKEELAWWATRTLWQIGQEVIGELEDALESAQGEASDRIHRALAGLRSKDDKRFQRLEKVQDDELLELFSHVGRILSEHKTLTWPAASRLLSEDVESGRITNDRLPTSPTDLRRKTKDLESRLDATLTNHKPGQKGGGSLTSEAISLLPLINEYLEARSLRRGGEP